MRNRKKVLTIGAVVLLAAGLAAGFVLAQDVAETEVAASAGADTLLGRVASILGIEAAALTDALQQARVEALADAVDAGRITEEQAEAVKACIEARNALGDVIDNALASGELTEEQAELLRLRGVQKSPLGSRLQGLKERFQGLRGGARDGEDAQGLCQRGQGSVQFGFRAEGPRGMMRGGFRGRCP